MVRGVVWSDVCLLTYLAKATAIPPKFAIRGSNGVGGDNFVVAMVDLDAPTPQAPTNAQIRHFLGGNFHPVSTRREQVKRLLNSTAAISEFRQPTPPAGSDPHR